MKLTAERVLIALPIIDRIVSEKCPLTVKGAYRMARLHAKMLPEFRLLEQRRDALIESYNYKAVPQGAPEGAEPVATVPPEKLGEFFAAWAEIGKEEIEFDLQPLPLSCIGPADAESPVNAAEMLALGDLLIDDSNDTRSA